MVETEMYNKEEVRIKKKKVLVTVAVMDSF